VKVGDLVMQLGLIAAGVGVVTRVYGHRGHGEPAYATVLWPDCVVDMSYYDLKVVSESR